MGGSGSTRWSWYSRKTQVEECHKWSIYSLKPYLKPGYWGSTRWMRGERESGNISFHVLGDETPSALYVSYTIRPRNSNPQDLSYRINLTTTPLPWGGVRYWFTCPLIVNNRACRNRVGCLYLPPRGQYFGCRHCYDLTYQSSQEKGRFDGLYRLLAAEMQGEYPGVTSREIEAMLTFQTMDNLRRINQDRFAKYLRDLESIDRYENYLTKSELCEQSGLTPEQLGRLELARLLVPDTKDGRYRPKLAGWGKKLAFLMGEGWNLDEIRHWAKGRWELENPRQWPPKLENWREDSKV